ncbi:GNAT family N-acetyltransferase [Lacimicrobium alkaliphilum]|uniref:GCN5 family acetyltransferase n=1 Tax=Lacimicrobium alkaliphilum TaxID=1526571 RepID=A0A0U3AZR2_9ALTE|nr:GNAT family N-acetyltransferase [Lacimicrobium alkaliphilum]ALS99599.1 GCN5 family acetyltransferase [Lacimicrobium alkaliphilum]
MKIEIEDSPSAELTDFLHQQIVDFNRAHRELNQRQSIAAVIRDEQNKIIAGAAGESFGNWLQLKTLWVDESQRGKRLGSQLLKAIESKAKARGCKFCLLDTLDIQAKPFYEKLGYKVQWTQQHYPLTGAKHFMIKEL